jgi:hypothetical protein
MFSAESLFRKTDITQIWIRNSGEKNLESNTKEYLSPGNAF